MARLKRHSSLRREGGFTIVEFMIAMAITTAVLGGTVVLATQIQQAYTNQLDDSAVEQEVRFALDWISRYLRSAGSNPYACAVFQPVWIDPNANGLDDDVRIQADINPPDGDCTDSEEDVTIAHDAVNNVITLDTGAGAVAMTDPIFPTRADGVTPALTFTYLDSSHNVTATEASIAYVRVTATGRSEGRNALTNEFTEFTLETEVRLRTVN
jgi:Tfp pilus assembly protein PilW